MRQRPRSPREQIVDRWLLVRYLIIGVYVGIATVGAFGWWFMSYPGGPQMTWAELTSASRCIGDACESFKDRRPSTMAMSTLVLIEMFNALNSLSENKSLLSHPADDECLVARLHRHQHVAPFRHHVRPILREDVHHHRAQFEEWRAVFWFSIPVIFIDEVLKYVTRAHRASINLWLKRGARGDILPRSRTAKGS